MAKKIRIQAELDDSKLKQQLSKIGKTKEKVTVDLDNTNINNTDQSMKKLNGTVASSNTIFGRLKSTISNTFSTGKLAMTAYIATLNEINKAAKGAKETIQEIDKAVTDLSIATNMSRESVSGLVKDYNNYAKELKSTTTQITSAADDYLRAGKTMGEAQALIKDSIMLSKLGKLDSGEATKDLLAVMNGYQMSINEVEKALDAMVAVDLEASTSAGDIATALKYCASSADAAGVSFNKLTGMIAQTQDKTMQSAETIGTFYNTLLSRYRDVKIGNYLTEDGEDISDYESVLKSVNVQLRNAEGGFRSFEVVLDELSEVWSTLSSTQQAAVIKVASGTRQQNRFVALMEGYAKALELTEVAANSAGTALDKFNNSYMNSLEAKQNALQASFESMVMNSDFSEVYAGILDATTALVDFINQTNALKGALTGLTVAGGIKGFLAIKAGVNEAYIALNKFQNALDIVKKTNISTREFDRLLLLSNGLSTSQMKLVLSTNALSVAQKKELLMASGLSEEEAILQLQTWKMTAANTGLTASTVSLGNAFKALWSTLITNPLVIVTALISGAVMAYQSYNQQLEETRQKNIELATTASESADKLKDLYNEYTRLASIQDRTTSEEEAFKTAVENITVALGDKADALDNLTAGTDEYADALARATQEELQSQAVTATIGRKSAEEEFQGEIWDDFKGSKVSIDSNSKGKSLSNEAQKAVDIVSDSLKEYETVNRTWKSIAWDINSEDPIEALGFYDSLVEAREKLVLASEDDEALLDTEIYEDLNSAINTMSESLDTYIEKLYEEQKLNYMANNGIPSTTEDYEAMEKALVDTAGSSGNLQNKFKELLMQDFTELVTGINDVGDAVDTVSQQTEDAVSLMNTSSISQTIDQFNTQLKPAMDSLKAAYQDIFTDDGFTLENVDTSMLDSIKSTIDELNSMEDVDINIDYSSFENLAKVLTDTTSTADEVHEAMDAFATDIVNSLNPAISECDGESYKLMQTLLESMGIVNAEEVLIAELGYSYEEYIAAKEATANAGVNLNAGINETIQQLNSEGLMASEDAQQIVAYMIAKSAADGATINVDATIAALAEEYSWLAELINQWQTYNSVSQKGHGNSSGTKNLGSGSYTPVQTVKQEVEVEAKFDGSKANSAAKSAGKSAGKSFEDGLREQLSDLDSVISGITGRIDDQISSVNEQKSAALESIDAQKEALEDAKDAAVDALEAERDARLEVIETQKAQLEEQIKLIEKQIKSKQDEIDKINEAAEARAREIDLQKKQYEFEKMQNQRPILQYSEDKGIHYVQDMSKIRDAKEAVDDAKRQIEIANLEKEIDILEDQKDLLNEQIDLLDERADKINEYYDEQIKKTEAFYDSQIKALEKQRKETEKFYESITKGLEAQKSKFQELTEILEKTELSAKLKQLGIDEEALLNGSEEEFNKLKDAYMNIVTQLNSGNDEVLSSLQKLSGYDGTAPAVLSDSNSELDEMNGKLDTSNQNVGNVNSSLGETATTTGNVASNVSNLESSLGNVNTLVTDEQTAFNNLKQIIDAVIEAINQKIQAIQESQSTVATATGSEMANFELLKNKILEVKESLDSISNSVTTLDATPVNNLTTSFQLLYNQLLLVAATLGAGMEGQEEGAVSGITSAIQALNEISLEEGIIAQFTNLKTAIDSVTAAISGGGGGESSGGGGQGGGSGSKSKGGESGSSGGKGSEGEGGGGNSLTGAITAMGETAGEVIGEPDAEGDGTVIGGFGALETAVNDVTSAIGSGDSEGSEGEGKGSGGEGESNNLIGSIVDLGETTEETLGKPDGDGVIARFGQFKDVIAEADEHVHGISEGLDEIDGKEVECTITVNIKTNGSLPSAIGSGMNLGSATYEAKYLGNAHVEGTALASGNWAVQSSENKALVGEEGFEIIVRNGRFFTVGNNGAEMTNIQKGDIVFNHEQSKNLLKYGHISGRGKAYADGTVGGGKVLMPDGRIFEPYDPDKDDSAFSKLYKAWNAHYGNIGKNVEEINKTLSHHLVVEYSQKMNEEVNRFVSNSNIVNNNRNVQPVVHQQFNVSLPNVTNSTVAESLMNDLQSLATKKYQVNW